MRIVLDSNALVASIGRKSPYRWLYDAMLDSRFGLLASTDILLEYDEILTLKTSPQVAYNVMNAILSLPRTELIAVYFRWDLIQRDKDDNKFTDCALAANADVLVSNDSDFQILKRIAFPKIRVATIEEFQCLLQ